ncbi:MAG: ABC transporter substrate-binding protein [Oscillospiraceae bacterium]|jgi:putative aldouronate transport system substrate-binding protein|nr:ABC transporter substrate-binding protein [Oscillospiraceae bacterium]
MSNMSKKLSVVLAAAMLCGMASGCSGSNSSSQSQSQSQSQAQPSGSASTSPSTSSEAPSEATLDPVTLEWYVSEGTHPDDSTVLGEVSKYMEEQINATLNTHLIPSDEYQQKVSTIIMSGQSTDIVNAQGSAIGYVDYVRKEAFIPIDELLTQYAPKTLALIPEGYWDAMKIDGKIYGIPSYKDSCEIQSMQYNETMANDLGITIPDKIHNGQDVYQFMYDAYQKRNEKYPDLASEPITRDMMGIGDFARYETISTNLLAANIPGIEDYKGQGSGEKVFNLYATDEYRDYAHRQAKLVADGLVPVQVWYHDQDRIEYYRGDYFFYGIRSGVISVAKNNTSDQFDSAIVPFDQNIASTNYLHQAVNCISTVSKNPERAMMALEIINTDPYVATTLRFGIEGTHWNMSSTEQGIADFTGTPNEDPSNRAYFCWYGAQFGSIMDLLAVPAGTDPNLLDGLKAANESANTNTNMGFIFDPKAVENEISACSSVVGEYTTDLIWGFKALEGEAYEVVEPKVDAWLDEFLAKLESSGIQKVIDEAQSQLDTWRAANK